MSSLFKRAIAEGYTDINPVSRMSEKPEPDRYEAEWLEIDEAARLLKATWEMDASPARQAFPHMYELIATYLYTGGRKLEVFGLQYADVDSEHGVIQIRPNRWRKLKKSRHKHTVPLWPDLNRILTDYLERTERTTGLLFQSRTGGMLTDIRGSLETALGRAEIEKHVTLHTLRHTYGATRMQTLDHGAPVSPYTVMRELGHRDLKLIEDTYGHLQLRRQRINVVEYRETQVVPFPAQAAR